MTALETALDLLAEGLWPIPITPVDDPSPTNLSPGKKPIGEGWGLVRHTPESLREIYTAHPGAGVGLKLGPEGGVIDIDVDDPVLGRDALDRVFGGEVPETRGWSSARGFHWLFLWDDRLTKYEKAIIKGPPLYPGIELRLGWSAGGKQYQSVCPPSVGTAGEPREWNGVAAIRPLPDSFFADLDRYAESTKRPAAKANPLLAPRSVALLDAEQRATAYLKACPPAVSGQRGHDRTFAVACNAGPGFDLPPDRFLRLLESVYNATCDPPWTEKEMRHKVEDAYRVEDRRGWLLNAERPKKAQANGHPKVELEAEPEPDPQPEAEPAPPEEFADDPFRLARSFLARGAADDGFPTIRFWLEEWHQWDGTRYRTVSGPEVRAAVVRHVKEEFDRIAVITRKPPVRITTGIVGNVLQALTGLSLLPQSECPDRPAWLDFSHEEMASPREIVPARNGLIHLPALVDGRTGIIPPTPRFFSPNCLGYDFNQDAPRPTRWLAFLQSVWGDDPESVRSLQEWFGYLLTPDTSQQKILVLIGPTRSGKGTITKILTSLVGELNVASPTLSGMATNFGVAPLIGKTVAIFPDARLSGRADSQVIVERLLSVSGEDAQTIDRKHLTSWSGHLTTRFVLVSNELPRLGDSSGAITARTVILRMTRSFLGNEDTSLFPKLAAEMPSILLWSIAGWARLRRRGRFVQPPSGLELVEEMRELASPVGSFIEERCDLALGLSIEIKRLYGAWKSFCVDRGKEHPGDEQGFGRMLRAAIPTLKVKRSGSDGHRVREYLGISLKGSF